MTDEIYNGQCWACGEQGEALIWWYSTLYTKDGQAVQNQRMAHLIHMSCVRLAEQIIESDDVVANARREELKSAQAMRDVNVQVAEDSVNNFVEQYPHLQIAYTMTIAIIKRDTQETIAAFLVQGGK